MTMLYGAAATAGIIRVGTQLDQNLLVALTDSAYIRNMPGWIAFSGTINGTLSDTSEGGLIGLGGADPMVAADEDEDVGVTDPSITAFTVSVGRLSLVRAATDTFIGTGAEGSILDPLALANDMPLSYERGFNGLVFNTFTSITGSTAGQSAQPLHVDDIMDAQFALQAFDNPAPFLCGVAPIGLSQFQNSLRGEMGAIAYKEATAAMIEAKSPGNAGSWNNINFAKFSDVVSTGGNRIGAMWSPGAFHYKTMTINAQRHMLGAGSVIAVVQGNVVVEIVRKPRVTTVEVIGNAWAGAAIREQKRACKLTHSAT